MKNSSNQENPQAVSSSSQKEKDWEDYQLLEETKKLRTAKSSLYVPKKDKYEDHISTAIIFCGFGGIGDSLVALNIFHILDIPFFRGLSSQITMFLLFTAFVVIGFVSWRKAGKLKSEIGTEEDTTTRINNWMKEHITKEALSSTEDSSASEEINILNKLNYIQDMVQKEFPEIDGDYRDLLVDNFYNSLYEDK